MCALLLARGRQMLGQRGRLGLVLLAAGGALAALALALAWPALREGELRDAAIAVWSRVGARAVDTADSMVNGAPAPRPVGVNTFLEQEVEPAKRREAVRMASAAG